MFNTYLSSNNAGYVFIGMIVLLIGAMSAARLFYKTGRPWFTAFVPIWNVLVVLDIVGRPRRHAAYFLIPFYNIYFYFLLCIELAYAFGKTSRRDVWMSCLFNILYVVNLALDYDEEYRGPIYESGIWSHKLG